MKNKLAIFLLCIFVPLYSETNIAEVNLCIKLGQIETRIKLKSLNSQDFITFSKERSWNKIVKI